MNTHPTEETKTPKSTQAKRFPQKHFSHRTTLLESNGPSGKLKGTAQQLVEKYLSLARDASREGDVILAEGFFQHAEHYRRILTENMPKRTAEEPSSSEESSAPESEA